MARNAATAPESQFDLDEKYDLVAVDTAIRKIEAAHRLGIKSIERHGESLHSKRSGIIPAFATDKGYRRDAVERARQFARVFTQKDVREICRECKKHNFPLGVTLIYRALPLGDPDERMKLLRRAIRGRWTQRRMVAKVHARTGAKTRRGRAQALPENKIEARQQIVSRVTPVIGWLAEVNDKKRALFAGLTSQVDQTITALQALVRAASRRRRRSR